mmetsp:Transcript_49224/g.123746  ORF Transcript_49224/g.123746 Transcript_49224/m.123746 type:complete len:192 (+) Transcript_49224:144-719(+)
MVRASPETHHEHFSMDLCATCYELPASFCFNLWCSPCAVYQQRARLIGNRWEENKCCMGYYGPCFDGCMRPCPRACTAFEACCCFWCSLFGNRAAIQDRYLIQNTACEDCLFWTACICSWIRCILSVFVNLPPRIDCVIDLLYCSLAACMITQQENELDLREGDSSHRLLGEDALSPPVDKVIDDETLYQK